MFSSALLYEIDNNTDDILISNILYIILGPLKSKKRYLIDISSVGYLFSGTVDNMSDLIGLEKIKILDNGIYTCAM